VSKKPSITQARRQAVRDERAALKAARPSRKRGATNTERVGDSFQNFGLNLGMGTQNALSGSTYGFNPITRVRTLLEWIYRGTWIGGVAVDLRAEDMTRAGIEINTTMPPDQTEKLTVKLMSSGCWKGMRDTKRWANLYGGAIGVIMIDGQDLAQPLRVDAIQKGSFRGMAVLDRWMVEPTITQGGLVQEPGPHLGKPKYYLIRSDSSMFPGGKIHYSRCLRLVGDEMPYWQSVMENMWGTSVYERIYDRLVAFDSATQGAAQSVYKSHIRTYKIAKLREISTAGGPAYAGLLRYVNIMRMFQGIEGVTLMDMSDEFVAHAPGVSPGISEALIQFGQQLCGALRIPAVRLFGMSPSGLNATGDSDWRNYYDGIATEQETELREFVDLLLRVIAMSEALKLPDGFGFNFTPLWQMTATQKAEVADKKTGTVLAVESAGLIKKSVAMKELRQQSRETGVFTNISDEDVREMEEQEKLEPPDASSVLGGGAEGDPRLPGEEGGAVPKPTSVKSDLTAVGPAKAAKGHALAAIGREQQSKIPRGDGAWRRRATSVRDVAYSLVPASHPTRGSRGTWHVRQGGNLMGTLEETESGEFKMYLGGSVTGTFPTKAQALASIGARDFMPLLDIGGLPILIECPKGESRWAGGRSWPADYGYIRRTVSNEGPDEAVDCFVGDDRDSDRAFVINHFRGDGEFEEHKVMLGYPTAHAAIGVYEDAYQDFRGVTPGRTTAFAFSLDKLRDWLDNGDCTRPLMRSVA
jgi:uncharacterized protein